MTDLLKDMDRIENIESGHGIIDIFRNPATGAVIYRHDGWNQSSADSNGISLASYIHAIFGLLSQAKARNTLIIGCGGGTLATMLAQAGRGAAIVDVDPASFTLARRHFALHDAVACHVADGEAFLRSGSDPYDAIVLDAFCGHHIPAHLQSMAFFELVRSRLTATGAVFANVHVKHDFDDYADRLAMTMKEAWPYVRVLDTQGTCDRNAIVMAGRVAQLAPPRLLTRPQMNGGVIQDDLSRLRFRAWKSSRFDFGR